MQPMPVMFPYYTAPQMNIAGSMSPQQQQQQAMWHQQFQMMQMQQMQMMQMQQQYMQQEGAEQVMIGKTRGEPSPDIHTDVADSGTISQQQAEMV